MPATPTSYWDYIKIEELLALQGGLDGSGGEPTNDEVMFIVVHQIDELWFKLALRELVSLRDLFASTPVAEQSLALATRGIRRMGLLFQQIAQHFALMETLTTRDYLAFRDKLSPASGFQSAQLREIEILFGLPDEERIPLGGEHSYMQALRSADGAPSPASRRVEARLEDKPTLKDAIHEWLYRTPIQGSSPHDPKDQERVAGFVESYLAAHTRAAETSLAIGREAATTVEARQRLEARYERERASAREFLLAGDVPEDHRFRTLRIRAAVVFIESYRELPLLAWPREVIDGIVALEQSFVIFRQRHARMVERVIGRRTGTGGSAGVEYLDQTALRYRIFRDIWAVRTLLIRAAELPPVEHEEAYDFAVASRRGETA
jgi:tryptophan 2,3-dioxygenase